MPLRDLKRLARHHIELSWNKGRMASVEQLHSKDFLYKGSFIGHPLDTAGHIRLLQDTRTAMPDLEVMIKDCIGEERKVFTWSALIGIIVRSTLSYLASDKVLSISAMGFWVSNPQGRLQELCTMLDMESFRAQLGLQIWPFAEKALP